MFERDEPEQPASQSQSTLSSAQCAANEENVALQAPESGSVPPPTDQHPHTPRMASPLVFEGRWNAIWRRCSYQKLTFSLEKLPHLDRN